MSKLMLICLIYVCLLHKNHSAKILGVFPNTGYSQYILGSSLMKELATRGHEVTVISPFAQNNQIPNYTDIKTDVSRRFREDNLFGREFYNFVNTAFALYDNTGLKITEYTLQDEGVQTLLRSNVTFELVVCELFANEAHMGFAYKYQAPLILFSSMGASEWTNHLVANPSPFSHVPITYSGYNNRMNFWQRLRNAAIGLFDILYRHFLIFAKQNEILQKHFPNSPHIKDLMYNVSLILLNSNVAINGPVPHMPSMVEIGGFHIAPKKLPNDLQGFLDGAHDGVVFFSMGSILKSTDFPKEKSNSVLRVFSQLKQKVLWKWEDVELSGKPDNVKIEKWLPQQDVLAHPNVRVFISHCGLLSTTEAVYAGVPVICIPIFADQEMNAEMAVSNGYALKLLYSELNEENLKCALNEILTNVSYRQAAQTRSKILRDQPLQPMDNAIFWIEYIMRHRGAHHLRSAAIGLHWYQYFLLDVLAFVSTIIVGILLLCKILLYTIFKQTKVTRKSKRQC